MNPERVLFRGFRPARDLVRSGLGALERQVVDIVWRKGSATVRDVQGEVRQPVAYTTVMTTLDRLYRKGLVTRTKVSRTFVYSAAHSSDELEKAIAADIMSELLSGDAATPAHPLLSNFVEAIGDRDRELLDELERLVKQKRERLKNGEPR